MTTKNKKPPGTDISTVDTSTADIPAAGISTAEKPSESGVKSAPIPRIKALFSGFASQRSVDGFAYSLGGGVYNAPRELGIARFSLVTIQCLLMMITFSAAIPVGMGMSVPASLLCCGLSTLIMILLTRGGIFIFSASSAVFITAYLSILSDRLDYTKGNLAFGMLASGLAFVLIGILIWAFSIQRLARLFDPLVAAPVTFLVGALTAIELARGADVLWLTIFTAAAGLAAFTLGGPRLRMLAPLAALAAGIVASAVSGQLTPVPQPGSIEFVAPQFELAVIGTILVHSLAALFPLFSLLCAGKLQSSGREGKPATESGYLIGAGLSLGLSGLTGAAPQLPSSHSLGLSAATGVYDPLVAAVSAALLIMIALIPETAGALAAIPQSVGMGVGLVLCASLMRFSAGSIGKIDFGDRRSSLIFFAVFAAGFFFEGAPVVIPIQGRPFTIAGLGAAVLTGTLLNLIIPKRFFK